MDFLTINACFCRFWAKTMPLGVRLAPLKPHFFIFMAKKGSGKFPG
jgi:hypothetical protein